MNDELLNRLLVLYT